MGRWYPGKTPCVRPVKLILMAKTIDGRYNFCRRTASEGFTDCRRQDKEPEFTDESLIELFSENIQNARIKQCSKF